MSAERKAFAFYAWMVKELVKSCGKWILRKTDDTKAQKRPKMFSSQPSFIIISYNKLLDQTSCILC